MSTGADCRFYQEDDGRWFYMLQKRPYGQNEEYDTFGPFPNFRAAHTHLHDHHANPGGYSAWPNDKVVCKHPKEFRMKNTDGKHETCEACSRSSEYSKTAWPAAGGGA